MIKILFFIESLHGGGAEKVLRTLVRHMDPAKFDITVQTLHPDAEAAELPESVHYRYCFRKKTKLTKLLVRLEAALGLLYPLHIRGAYDIECAYLECGATKIMASSTNRRAKKLAWVHCDVSVPFDRRFAEKTGKYYRKFDRVICVSEKCRESFIEMFGRSDGVDILYNVIDDQEILEKARMPLPPGAEKRKLTLCCVGRFSPQKNYPRLLNACAALRREGYDFDLWILGDGEQRNSVEQLIERLGLSDCVKLFGFQANPYPLMRMADLLVCSSDYEGYSTVACEAMILEKPFLTTDVSGMREILGESEYGLITPVTDEGFLLGLRELLADEEKRRFYGKRAVERGAYFSAKALCDASERFFTSLVASERI